MKLSYMYAIKNHFITASAQPHWFNLTRSSVNIFMDALKAHNSRESLKSLLIDDRGSKIMIKPSSRVNILRHTT